MQFHLQQGRPYAVVAAGAALSALLLVPLLDNGPGRRTWPRWTAYGCLLLVCALLN
ncbi:hypothetical protein ACIRP0_23300 [Streptomyces sp. NPDC101733]|uniref:hypothetical protein n=1 Tax=unclassified Streptomyces TaxID=2593676 RepID=UPI003823C92A